MSTTSLPAGDTVSSTALAETHTNTQHTVTGECVHISCCTSEDMAVTCVATGEGKPFHMEPLTLVRPVCLTWVRLMLRSHGTLFVCLLVT